MTLLGNGCLCCNTRTDLQNTLRKLVADRDRGKIPHFGRVLIETSGLADLGPILQTFSTDRALGGEFAIEVVLTVVDAVSGLKNLEKAPEARKQAILADRLVISKTDLADGKTIKKLTGDAGGPQSARRDRRRGEGRHRSEGADRHRPGRRHRAAFRLRCRGVALATASSASSCATRRR